MSKAKVNLLSIMAKRNITPRELQRRSGLSKSVIDSLIEDQREMISFDILATLCEILDCEIGDLIVLEKEVS